MKLLLGLLVWLLSLPFRAVGIAASAALALLRALPFLPVRLLSR